MLSLIVAIAQNGALGKDKKMIWHLPEDLKRFKKITENHTVILGRKTFQGLGRKLPNRKHIIITSGNNFEIDDSDINISNDLISTLEKYKDSDKEVFVIGGASVYKKAIDYCHKLYITEVYKDFDADTYLNLDYSDFTLLNESHIYVDEKSNIKYKYLDYKRK